jgi:hypothetical protein
MLLAMDLHWIAKALELGLAAVHLPNERAHRVAEERSIATGSTSPGDSLLNPAFRKRERIGRHTV